jgi:AcrR family transcriptional regulator
MATPAQPAQTRRWAKTGTTQRRILDAATEVFATRGFAAATMADLVAASGASIGSIYHHFGGKSELFLAMFEQMAVDVDRRIDAAMQQAGEGADPRAVFEAHVRGFLESMWENQRLAQVLTSGDTPAGFQGARRNRMHAAFRHWMAVLELDASVRGELLKRLLVASIAESSLLIAECENADDVQTIIDATIEWIDRLTD